MESVRVRMDFDLDLDVGAFGREDDTELVVGVGGREASERVVDVDAMEDEMLALRSCPVGALMLIGDVFVFLGGYGCTSMVCSRSRSCVGLCNEGITRSAFERGRMDQTAGSWPWPCVRARVGEESREVGFAARERGDLGRR